MHVLRALAIIFSLLTLIGAGHGAGPVAIFEIMSISALLSGDFQFNISGQYDDRLLTGALVNLVAQSTLITAFFFDRNTRSQITIVGCLLLLTAIYILTKDVAYFNLDMFTLQFGLPTIVTSLVLIFKEINELRAKHA